MECSREQTLHYVAQLSRQLAALAEGAGAIDSCISLMAAAADAERLRCRLVDAATRRRNESERDMAAEA